MYRFEADTLVAYAPAKLNLFLKVAGKRADGYHEIETVLQTIDLFDTLSFRQREDSQVSLEVRQTEPGTGNHEVIPSDEKNLVVQAVKLLQEKGGRDRGVDITLIKRIPSQAGLGGGSSDAASTINALNRLWNLNLTLAERCQLAARLGSDIPFFVTESPLASCSGKGEQVEAEKSRKMHFVVVKPHSGLSTAKVYANCVSSAFSQTAKDVIKSLHKTNLSDVESGLFYNSLEEPARRLNQDVERTLERLEQQPFLKTMMSGSGTACFGLCRSRRQAFYLAQKLHSMDFARVYVAQSRV